jgi:hypothetical protein
MKPNELIIPMITLFVGSAITLMTICAIEKPKLDLEAKKTFLEAQNQIALMTPNIDSSCEGNRITKYTKRLRCYFSNSGQYASFIHIEEVEASTKSDGKKVKYFEGNDYKVTFDPQDKRSFISTAGSKKANLYINVSLDSKKNQNGYDGDLILRVTLKYEVPQDILNPFVGMFPDLGEAAKKVTTTYSSFNL